MAKRFGKRVKKANPVKMSGVLHSVIINMGVGQDIRLNKLKENWEDIVGPVNARNTKPVALKDNKLTVAVFNPTHFTQIHYNKTKFLENINSFHPQDDVVISDVRFVQEQCLTGV